MKVGTFLTLKGLKWEYEKPVEVIDNYGNKRTWYPDFYVPELNIYIEVCGKYREKYAKTEAVYHKNNIPIIFVHTYKEDKWEFYLEKRLIEYMAMLSV